MIPPKSQRTRSPRKRARGKRPTEHCDVAVIGAGPAGLAAAHMAANAGKRVVLFESQRLGGTSLNTGSVPSKALIRSATLFAAVREASGLLGSETPCPVADLGRLVTRLQRIEARIAGYNSLARLSRLGIETRFAVAAFADRRTLSADGRYLRFDKAIVATGAVSARPRFPGIGQHYVTSETIFGLTQLPRRLAVVGGGPLGCELAQAFCRLGSIVTIIQDDATFLPREERDAAQILARAMARDGVNILLNTRVIGARLEASSVLLEAQNYKTRSVVSADCVLVSIGRIPNIQALHLEAARIASDPVNGVKTDDFLRTSNPHVFAAGDVCMSHKFTHVAESTAHIATHNALGGAARRHSGLIVPWCTFCAPEIAHVGLQVWEARQRSIPIKTYTVMMHDIDRAITDRQDNGFVKLHVAEGKDRILGATIVASRASEMINEVCVAMHSGIGLRRLAQVIHTYPSQSAAIRSAALSLDRRPAHPLDG